MVKLIKILGDDQLSLYDIALEIATQAHKRASR